MGISHFWNKRFIKEGKIWGLQPTKSARIASDVFKQTRAKKILVCGCAYGRNAIYFAKQGFDVTAIDNSPIAIEMATKLKLGSMTKLSYQLADARNLPFEAEEFDAVFDHALLHLLSATERLQALKEYRRVLKPKGFLVLCVFSVQDPSYGKGRKVDENTFESRVGRVAHYFDNSDLQKTLQSWQQLASISISEEEEHSGSKHSHCYILSVAAPRRD